MELPKILFVLVSVLMISGTEAFLPSHAGRSLASADYTLTDITVAGIVRVVARYFEDSDPDRYSPGDLTGLIPLTPSKLYQVHYGGKYHILKTVLAFGKLCYKPSVETSGNYLFCFAFIHSDSFVEAVCNI